MAKTNLDSECDSNLNLNEDLPMFSMEPGDLRDQTNLLKIATSFYQEQTAKMEAALSRAKVISDRIDDLPEDIREDLDKLCQLLQHFNTKDMATDPLVLSYVHRLKKQNKYLTKLKICIKTYVNLNEMLTKKIEELKREYKQSRKKIDKIVTATADEMKIMEKKINLYEHELIKLEKKYPWLKNSQFDLPNISKEINLLATIRKEKEALVEELSCYHGLKPDLQAAQEQLSQMKIEYEEISAKLLDKNN